MNNYRQYERLLNNAKEELAEYYYAFDIIEGLSKIKNIKPKPMTKLYMSFSDIAALVHDFYQEYTNDYFYQAFIKSLLKTTIFIEKYNENIGYFGEQTLEDDNNYSLRIFKQNTFDDITTLAHECAHSIDCELNPLRKKYFLETSVELTSTFMENLCLKYLEEHNFRRLSLEVQANVFKIHLNDSKNINNLLKLVKYYKNNTIKTQDEIAKITVIEDKADVELIKYILSYVVSLNLLKLYEVDPELVFYILKKVIMFDETTRDYDIFNLLNGYELYNVSAVEEYKQELIRKSNQGRRR